MRASRRGVWVESLETRRLFAVGAAAPHAAPAGSSIVLASAGASMDFLTAGDTVSNASGSVVIDFLRGDDTTGSVSVNYITSDGTAHDGTDYIAKSGTVQFGAGETMKSVTITLIDRPSAPGSQAFTVALTSPSPGAYLGARATHTVTLQNDRAPVALAATAYGTNTDDTGVDVVVTRTGNTDIAVGVDYATADGSAHAGQHYSDTHGTLTFGAGQISKSVHVPLLGDRDAADGVTFAFALSGATDGAVLLGATSATVTIHNAYSPVQFDDSSYTVTTDFPDVTVVVTRTGNTTGPATVHYATSDGTAADALDYTAATGTVSFAAGETAKLLDVHLLDNLEATGDRTFSLTLSSPGGSGVLGATSSTVITVQNNYSPVRFAAAGYSVTIDDDHATLTVTRSGNLSVAATVAYATSPLTASAVNDYTNVAGTLSFDPGEDSKTIEIPLAGNHAAGDGRQFLVSLGGGTGGAVLGTPGDSVVTIGNSHSPIQLDASAYSATTDDTDVTLTVVRTGNIGSAVSVHYATFDGTAADGDDYAGASGVLSFGAGDTSATITIPLLGNFGADDGATFGLVLGSPAGSGAELGATDSATITVANSHSLVQFAAVSYVADARDGVVTLTVVRSGNTSAPASVDFATADGTAVSGDAYAGTSGTLAFGPGETTQTVDVALLATAGSPASQSFSLGLSFPDGNASLGALDDATVSIQNHQSVVQFAAGTYAVDADAGTATLTLSRSGNTSAAASVDYATADGTATAGTDYTSSSGTVSFLAGQTTRTVSVPVHVHAAGPADVDFTLSLSNAGSDTAIGTSRATTVTVHNSHAVVEFESASVTVSGDDGAAHLIVRRTGNTALAGSVNWATASDTAVAGVDYAAASGALSFAAGESTKSIEVTLPGNSFAPGDLTFHVTLSGGSGATVLGTTLSDFVTITNIHSVVTFATTSFAVGESAGTVTFTLTRAGNLGRAVSVGYVTADGTASAGSDYVGAAGTVSFAPGQSIATFDVLVNSDLDFDPNETFSVALAAPADGAVIGAAPSATVTLADTTPAPTFAGGGLVSLVKPGRLDALSLTFDQALDSAPAASAFTLFRRVGERAGVAPRLLPVILNGVTYDAASHSVTVRSAKPLKAGLFYQLAVSPDAVRNRGGLMLDGSGTGQEGTPLVVTFAQGHKLRYVDHDGDTVQLMLKGPGVLQLVRRTDGEGERLTLAGATLRTRLMGLVRHSKFTGDDHTTLGELANLGPATNLLSPAQFDVAGIL